MTILINEKEKALVNSEDGDIVRPTCWDQLHGYYNYLKTSGKPAQAQTVLDDVYKGELVMTQMVDYYQRNKGGQQR